MPVDRVWCESADLCLYIANVKESATLDRPSILVSPGITETDIGGSTDRVLQEVVERLSFFCRTEVIGFNPHGIGESSGTLSTEGLGNDLFAIAEFLKPRSLVMIGFGLIGYAMLTCTPLPQIAGIVTVDPLADPHDRDELTSMGVRLDPDRTLVVADIPIDLDSHRTRWLVIVPGDQRRSDDVGLVQRIERYRPEVHRIFATPSRLGSDPRPYALILGWLERELWTNAATIEAPRK
jgi:hypothetical protein